MLVLPRQGYRIEHDGQRIGCCACDGAGFSGTGKTTLMQQITANEHVVARFGQRCWLIKLAKVTNAADLRVAILKTIGFDPAITKFQAALRRLRRKPALLILTICKYPGDRIWRLYKSAYDD